MVHLEFKKWAESIFGRGIMDDPEPASQIPLWLNKIQNGAFPQYDLEPLPGNKKSMKKMKKKI
jgi:hypothetical protein